LHHHVRASQQPLVPSARRPAAEAETNTERERATTASVNAVAAYVGNTPAVFRVSNFDPACAGGDRRGALVVEQLDVGEARKVDPQIPNSRLSACTPAGSPKEILREIGLGVAGGNHLRCIVARMEHDPREHEKLDEAVEDMRSDAEEMQERSEDLGDRIEETKSDWHRKQQDDAVPGAQPPPDDEAKHPLSKPT
jgi:hypothetical protein